jgi:thiol-disulfide isomerase/thioredoxin
VTKWLIYRGFKTVYTVWMNSDQTKHSDDAVRFKHSPGNENLKRLLPLTVLAFLSCTAAMASPAFDQGLSLYNEAKYVEAAQLFQQDLSENPNDVLSHYYLALSFHCLGHLPEAYSQYIWVSQSSTDPEIQKRVNFGLHSLAQAGVQIPQMALRSNNGVYGSNPQPNQLTPVAGNGGAEYPSPQQASALAQQQFQQPGINTPQYSAFQGNQAGTWSQSAPSQRWPGTTWPNLTNNPYPNQMHSAPDARLSGSIGTPPLAPSFQTGRNVNVSNLRPSGPAPKVIDMYTDWCGWCKRFEPFFLQAQAKYGSQIAFVRANAEAPENQNLVKKYKVRGFPTLLYLDASGNLVKRGSGAPLSLEDFESDLFAAFPNIPR